MMIVQLPILKVVQLVIQIRLVSRILLVLLEQIQLLQVQGLTMAAKHSRIVSRAQIVLPPLILLVVQLIHQAHRLGKRRLVAQQIQILAIMQLFRQDKVFIGLPLIMV